jgi:hypothetical protein
VVGGHKPIASFHILAKYGHCEHLRLPFQLSAVDRSIHSERENLLHAIWAFCFKCVVVKYYGEEVSHRTECRVIFCVTQKGYADGSRRKGMVISIVVKAARMLGDALHGIRLQFH